LSLHTAGLGSAVVLDYISTESKNLLRRKTRTQQLATQRT